MYARVEGCVEKYSVYEEDEMLCFEQAVDLEKFSGEQLEIIFTEDNTVEVFASGICLEFPMSRVRMHNMNCK